MLIFINIVLIIFLHFTYDVSLHVISNLKVELLFGGAYSILPYKDTYSHIIKYKILLKISCS